MGDEKPYEDGREKDVEDDRIEDEKSMSQVVPYEINDMEYMLPIEVVKYIEGLINSKVEAEDKVTQMAAQTPSTMPIGTVVKTADETDDINGRVSMFSSFKGFRHRV